MRTQSGLVGLEDVGAHDFSVAFRDMTAIGRMLPVGEGLFPGNAGIEGIRVAPGHDVMENLPDKVAIRFESLPYRQHG